MKYKHIEPWMYKTEERYLYESSLLVTLPDFDHEFFIKYDGRLAVKKGYAWDGPTGIPQFLHTKSTIYASLIHDVFYQAISLDLVPKYQRRVIDRIFYQALVGKGMNRLVAAIMHMGVRKLYPLWAKLPKNDYSEAYEI